MSSNWKRSASLTGLFVVAWAVIPTTIGTAQQPSQQESGQSAEKPADSKQDNPTPAKQQADLDKDVPAPKQPSASDVLRAFQKDRPTNTVIRPKTSYAAARGRSGTETGDAHVRRDGDFLNNRPGRLVREGMWWNLVFESDSAAEPEPPLPLLPNQQLERMVRETKASTEGVVFIVSGEVTLFEGDNYLLVRKALRRRDLGNLQK